MVETIISLDMLDVNGVSVKRQRVTEVDGETLNVGVAHRKAYQNNGFGRAELLSEVPEVYCTAILAVWNTNPPEEEETE